MDIDTNNREQQTKTRWYHHLIPCRFNQTDEDKIDIAEIGFLQVLFFTWLTPLVQKGVKKSLLAEDLGNCTKSLQVSYSLERLLDCFPKNKSKDNVSYFKLFINFFFKRLLIGVLTLIVCGFTECFVAGYLVRRFLEHITSEEDSVYNGVYLALLLTVMTAIRSMLKSFAFFIGLYTGIYAKAAFQGLVYKKLLKLKASRSQQSTGELVNLCANDSQRVMDFCMYVPFLIYFPIHIIIIYTYLYFYFGPAAMASCVVFAMYIPFQIGLGKIFSKLRAKGISYTDKRVKMISEALMSIKLIKLYAWEESFAKVICALRKKETKFAHMMGLVEGITFSLGYAITVLAPATAIGVQMLTNGELSVPKAFTLIALNNASIAFITVAPLGMRACAEMIVSMKRLKKVMLRSESDGLLKTCEDKNNVVEITDATLSWGENPVEQNTDVFENDEATETDKLTVIIKSGGKAENGCSANGIMNIDESYTIAPTLKNINLSVKKGSLIGICGSVGCGKSSLVQSILNEMTLVSGKLKSTNSIAYVPQQAWIVNATVQENILLGQRYEEAFYKDVITACALDNDLKMMKSGDLTEIGERGVNLSGGQKQRVSLARAVYAEKELYLLDDPLSAVDINVGQQIFEKCIRLALQKHTVLFITHQLQYLKHCDHVIYMKDGCFHEQGLYNDLANNKTEFAEMLKKFYADHKKNENTETANEFKASNKVLSVTRSMEGSFFSLDDLNLELNEIEQSEELQQTKEGRITVDEEIVKGTISWRTYKSFMKAAGGVLATFIVILGIGSTIGVQISAEYCLTQYLSYIKIIKVYKYQNMSFTNNTLLLAEAEGKADMYSNLYWSLGSTVLLCSIVSVFITVGYVLRGSSSLHNTVLQKMFHAPLTFFERTPIGQIVNRFSKDVDEIDNFLPLNIENFIRIFFRVTAPIIFVCVAIPYYTIALIIELAFMVGLSFIFRKVVRALKRIDHRTRSPIYSHITATIQGISSIHSYNKEDEFEKKFFELLDCNSNASYLYFASTRWFALRMDLVCVSGLCVLALVGVFFKASFSPAIFALSFIYTLQVIGMLQYGMRQFAETEARFTSVERLHHYIKTVTSEGSFETENKTVLKDWPKNGEVSFANISFRYQKNLPLALKNLSFSINDKEKVGIVGRTGAGKSSIANVLFRLVHIASGNVYIGGVDIALIGLSDLRSSLSMIPQDPVLFIGTIRYNLDPFSLYSDDDLWHVLEKAQMKKSISNLPDKLETNVTENGSNFSVGERQLICMARALLRKSKILLLDEATAAIDTETDLKIQNMIKEAFAQCTVLTIAHRLNTIMHCNRILVMEKGEICEFDSPENLLSNVDSIFREMVVAANIRFEFNIKHKH